MCHPRNFIPVVTLLTAFVSAAPCSGQDRPRSGELSFWTVGNEGTALRFGPDLYRILENEEDGLEPILLAIAEQPLSEVQILERTGLSGARLLDLLPTLSALHIVTQGAEDRWATTLPVITDHQMRRIRQSLIPVARAQREHSNGVTSLIRPCAKPACSRVLAARLRGVRRTRAARARATSPGRGASRWG